MPSRGETDGYKVAANMLRPLLNILVNAVQYDAVSGLVCVQTCSK
jgi:hypothetical protein